MSDPAVPSPAILPKPYKESWREAYRYDKDDSPRFATYQAPEGTPVPFVQDSLRLSGGQSVDTAEYPFFGFWSNTPLNEKPQAITVTGFIRGDFYIQKRNNLVEALQVLTSDEAPGYIDLPLWGRFPVVVVSYEVGEKGRENGQCSVSITLTRAGIPVEERWQFTSDYTETAERTRKDLDAASLKAMEDKLRDNAADPAALASGFTQLQGRLIAVIGRVQGAQSRLNAMTNAAVGITNLIAQGIRAPRELAQAFIGAVAEIVGGVMDIKNSAEETAAYSRTPDNVKNVLMQFLSAADYRAGITAVTAKQHAAKTAVENVYKAAALGAAGQLLVRLGSDATYQQTRGYWELYTILENSVDQNNPGVYRAVQDLRHAVTGSFAARRLDAELTRHINLPVPLLYLSRYLSCDDETLRRLNGIADSFFIRGEVRYV
jgi:prophage DNA circulation protein